MQRNKNELGYVQLLISPIGSSLLVLTEIIRGFGSAWVQPMADICRLYASRLAKNHDIASTPIVYVSLPNSALYPATVLILGEMTGFIGFRFTSSVQESLIYYCC